MSTAAIHACQLGCLVWCLSYAAVVMNIANVLSNLSVNRKLDARPEWPIRVLAVPLVAAVCLLRRSRYCYSNYVKICISNHLPYCMQRWGQKHEWLRSVYSFQTDDVRWSKQRFSSRADSHLRSNDKAGTLLEVPLSVTQQLEKLIDWQPVLLPAPSHSDSRLTTSALHKRRDLCIRIQLA